MGSQPGHGPELQRALAEAPTIDSSRSTVHRCPALRACPTCYTLVTHSQQGCPTVWCPHCATSFCFRCLKVGYCGYRTPPCPIRRRQRLGSEASGQGRA